MAKKIIIIVILLVIVLAIAAYFYLNERSALCGTVLNPENTPMSKETEKSKQG